MGLPSPSALGNKSSLLPEAILIILSVVPHAARKGRHGSTAIVAIAMEMIATGPNAKCSLRYAPSVEKLPRCHSSPAKVGRCIAAIATVQLEQADNAGLLLKAYIGWGNQPM